MLLQLAETKMTLGVRLNPHTAPYTHREGRPGLLRMTVKRRKLDGSKKKLTEKVSETMESSTALKVD